MAFTYRKQVSFNAYSDGISKKMSLDFSKEIAADVKAPLKISGVDSFFGVYVAYENVTDADGNVTVTSILHHVLPSKVSVHGAIVEFEFLSPIPVSSTDPVSGTIGTASAFGGNMFLYFDLM